jgi:hypothetical protein
MIAVPAIPMARPRWPSPATRPTMRSDAAMPARSAAPPSNRSDSTAPYGSGNVMNSTSPASTSEAFRSVVTGDEPRPSRGSRNAPRIAPRAGASVKYDASTRSTPKRSTVSERSPG